MRTFSFYFHSGALAQPIRRHRAHLGTVSTTCVRVVMQCNGGRRPCGAATGRGGRPRGGDDPTPFGNHPAFYCNPTQPAYGTCPDELWPPIKQTYLRQGIANSIGYFLVYSTDTDRQNKKKNNDQILTLYIIISLYHFVLDYVVHLRLYVREFYITSYYLVLIKNIKMIA